MRLALRRHPYFKQRPAKVVPFGSGGNGSWLMGADSLNLAIMFDDREQEIDLVGESFILEGGPC